MKKLLTCLVIATLILSWISVPVTSVDDTRVDILHYNLNLQIEPIDHLLKVQAHIRLRALDDGITRASFLLNEGMVITDIRDGDGNTLSFNKNDDQLIISLMEPLNKSEEIEVVVEYFGVSKAEEKFGRYGFWGYVGDVGSYMIYESAWYPMVWGDRYTVTTSISVPKGQTAISVGELVGQKDLGEYSEFTWHTAIPTRGISFAAGDYKIKSTLFKHTIVECYTYQEAPSLSNKCLKTATDMLQFYSTKFSDYPYAKFAVVEIPEFFSGGHGDQSFVMMDSNLFRSFLPSEFLAHEVAHNWWGALVFAEGENSLRSVKGYWNFPKANLEEVSVERYNYWLLEGFATYSSLLYIEDVKGRDRMISSLEEKRGEYLNNIWDGQDEPISNVEEEYGEGKYHALVYSKGAWVLHMLRYVVGDQAFYSIMRNYAKQFREKSATINDFQEVSEDVYRKDLDWFFDQWVDGVMLPDYTIGKADVEGSDGEYIVRATVIQKGDLGKMPVEIILHTEGDNFKKRIWIDEKQETVSFTTDRKPTHIEIDADNWILESNKNNNIYFLSSSSTWRKLKLIIWRLKQLLPII